MFRNNGLIFARKGEAEPWTHKEFLLFLGVIGLALAIRLYFVFAIQHPELFGDDQNYDQLVRQWLDTGIYGYRSKTPNAYVTPGFPLFLAVIYKLRGYSISPLVSVRLAQALMLVASVALIYLIARKIGGKTTAIFSAALAAIYPPLIWSASALLTESLFTFVFLAYFYTILLVFDKRSFLLSGLSGLLFGVGVLTRPQIAPFFFVPFLIMFIREKKRDILALFLVFICAFGLTMLPWWVRNYITFNKVILSATQTGNPLLAGTDPYFKLGTEKLFKGVKPQDQTDYAIQRIKNGFKNETLLYLKWFTAGKFWVMFKEPWKRFTGDFMLPFAKLHLPIVILGWAGVLLGLFRHKMQLLAATVIFATLIQLLFLPLPRYVFPVIPFLIISGVYLVVEFFTIFFGRIHSRSICL